MFERVWSIAAADCPTHHEALDDELHVVLLMTWNPLHWSSWAFFTLIAVCLAAWLLMPRDGSHVLRLTREALLVCPAVLLYFAVRGLVDADPQIAYRHAQRIINVEQTLGIFHEPQVQRQVLKASWRTDLANWIYIWAHWPVLVSGTAWLAVVHHRRYPLYRNAFLLSGALGMIVFLTFPVAPPRLMTEYGFVDTVLQRSRSYRVLQPPSLENLYASMPSLHFGWNLLMGIAIFRESRHVMGRVFAVVMPPAMYLAIVATANHYFLDGLVGGALVILSLIVVSTGSGVVARLRRLLSGRWPTRVPAPTAFGPSSGDPTHARVDTTPPSRAGNQAVPRIDEQDSSLSALLFQDHPQRPLTIAHRFANDLDSLRLAEQSGVDLVEADVWLHRGRLEVRHSKTLGPIPVRWDRWSIGSSRPACLSLAELLQAPDFDTELLLDVKGRDARLPARLVAELRTVRPGRPILVCSQNWRLLDRFKPYDDVVRVHSIGNRRQLRRAWERLAHDGHDAVSIQYRLLNAPVVDALKQRVSLVVTWPINDAERLALVTGWGVDGVISDDLALLRDIVNSRGPVSRSLSGATP